MVSSSSTGLQRWNGASSNRSYNMSFGNPGPSPWNPLLRGQLLWSQLIEVNTHVTRSLRVWVPEFKFTHSDFDSIKTIQSDLVWTRKKKLTHSCNSYSFRLFCSQDFLGSDMYRRAERALRMWNSCERYFQRKKLLIYIIWVFFFPFYIIILMCVIYTWCPVYFAVGLCLSVWDPIAAGRLKNPT